ncbi:MAG: hypothetical protein N2491_12150 [Negativicutes bacterium]|nr:hypothetical protein [Negativicutes bacterium]
MHRKIIALALIMLISFANTAAAAGSGDLTLIAKTEAVEKVLYGAEQTGALLDRVNKLEKDIFGAETRENLAQKLERVYSFVKEIKPGAPSLVLKLNTVEWLLTHSVSNDAAKARLEALERTMYGNSSAGAIDERLNKLLKLSLTTGWPDVAGAIVTKDTLVKIKLVSDLSTKTNRVGDTVVFRAAEDVFADGLLVIAKGARGTGKITKLEPRKSFGRDAKLEVAFETIEAVDGSMLATLLGDKAKEETKSLAKAAGASFAGLVLLGPVGVVGGAFVNGKDVNIPAGTELYIQTSAEAEIHGIKLK